jgi:hypothetical protein
MFDRALEGSQGLTRLDDRERSEAILPFIPTETVVIASPIHREEANYEPPNILRFRFS